MRLPGFTAEGAIATSVDRYRGMLVSSEQTGVVVPQLPMQDYFNGCLATCKLAFRGDLDLFCDEESGISRRNCRQRAVNDNLSCIARCTNTFLTWYGV